jgi:glycogen debranching enzyme
VEDVIQVQDQFYILSTASRAGERVAVLQDDETFALFDLYGDVGMYGPSEHGLYHDGTRHLSHFGLRLNGRRPLLLSARVKEDNELFGADLTNPDIPLSEPGTVLARDIVHVFRSRFLWQAAWHERVRLRNYGHSTIAVALTFDLDADFADIFEVRGTRRARRGMMLDPQIDEQEVRLRYRGLDELLRWTSIRWDAPPAEISSHRARFEYKLEPREAATLTFEIRCGHDKGAPARRTCAYDAAAAEALEAIECARRQYCVVESSSERFNRWVRRSAADIRMLTSATPEGPYPYAGVPWFSTPFGRDGIITALQMLWVNPKLARGVLGYLAATQADDVDAERDAEPGKILHERRRSEMARLGEVPFGCYYGSVDATPLFVILAGEYFARSGDRAFVADLWPHVERALEWIDRYGDRDGDGFVEYARRSSTGLVQQGWKDSQDSVFHADGTLAETPIALCEVQGYVYAARKQAATLADALGDGARAARLRQQAEDLRVLFEATFWCEEEGTYALALDGRKRPCRVRASNAGHCLFAGIASTDRARRVADLLVGQEMYSGWGIRTVAAAERRYNPMSYHNGSVWPHDNGLIAAGFSRYGFDDLIMGPFGSLFDASAAMDAYRLPELLCGFRRRPGEGPTLYPVACSPQAWASGVVFQLIQACTRMSIDVDGSRLLLHRPMLPPFLTYLKFTNLALPFGSADLQLEHGPHGITATVLRQSSDQLRVEITA